MSNKKGFIYSLIAASMAAVLAAPGAHVSSAIVSYDNDMGPCSLRTASVCGKDKIRILKSVGDINIATTLEYTGTSPVSIKVKDQNVYPDNNITLFV